MPVHAPTKPVFRHVAIHEAGHAVVLRAVLGETASARPVDMGEPEPRAWTDVFERLARGGADPTRVTAFLLGGTEALVHAAELGPIGASRYHGLNGPDGAGSDSELVDTAVMALGADRWRATDLARDAVRRSWPLVAEAARAIAASGRMDPGVLAPLLARVTRV